MLTVTVMICVGIALVNQIDKSDMEPKDIPADPTGLNNSAVRQTFIGACRIFFS